MLENALWWVIRHVSQIDSFRERKWLLAAFIDEAGGLAGETSETLNLSSWTQAVMGV